MMNDDRVPGGLGRGGRARRAPAIRAAVERAALALALLGSASCGGAPAAVIRDLTWTPADDPRVPLVLDVRFETDVPTRATVRLDDGERPKTIRFDGRRTQHELLVLGMAADTAYEVTVEVAPDGGPATVSAPWSWHTPALPDWFPPLHVTVCRPERMEPGVTMIPCSRWPASGAPDRDRGALVAVDEHGDVVWFFEAPHAISEVRRMSTGNLLYYHGTNGNIVEMDMRGRVVRQWATTRIPGTVVPDGAIPVDASSIHHDVQELPWGNLLALSTELRRFERYPTSEEDPNAPWGPARVVGDVILEIASDGEVVNRWPVLDLLDPLRIGYESLDWGFWAGLYENLESEPLRDWAHVNSLDYDARDHALVVSSYHQDAVFEMDLDTGEIDWILGFPTGWGEEWRDLVLTPVGDGLYPFHQHAARFTPHGTLLMFDNGKYRALPYQPKMAPEDSFSRAVEFEIDEEALEFREVWSYGGRLGEQFFTPFLGETDWLPVKGNVLVTDGGRVTRPNGLPGVHPNQGRKWARVFEVTHTTPAEVVFEVLIDDHRAGWTVYRSERLPSLYP